jgi:CRISPR/Cas system CSM-associated protein Csm4 (group 5 of RAMP superfamily)
MFSAMANFLVWPVPSRQSTRIGEICKEKKKKERKKERKNEESRNFSSSYFNEIIIFRLDSALRTTP